MNNLPWLVQQVAQDMGDELTYESNTPGGCTFSQHCTNNSMTMIQQGGWDVVVLQEQSQLPSFPPSQVENECFPYAARLVDSVYANGDCTEPMFYMTWGRKDGDGRNGQFYPPLATYEGMDSLLYHRYMYMGEANDASVCPVGRVWRVLREQHSDIELYSSDGSHPSEAGSFAAAVAFYTMIYERSPEQLNYSYTLDPSTATIIKRVVKNVVFDSLDKWKRPEPSADFSYSESNGQVVFNNSSLHAASYEWQFGDGETSTANAPTHSYAETGTYVVTLIATRHCMSDTIASEITVTEVGGGVGIDEAEGMRPEVVYTAGRVSVAGNYDFEIIDISGRAVARGTNSVDISHLPQGLYLVRVFTEASPYTVKIIK